MAHSTLHFSIGMLLGTLWTMPRLFRSWRSYSPLTRPVRQWLLLSLLLGTIAVLPGLLRRFGAPDTFCDGWWMNLFLFYPLINKLKTGGSIPGFVLIAFFFSLQYVAILTAIVRHHSVQSMLANQHEPTPNEQMS